MKWILLALLYAATTAFAIWCEEDSQDIPCETDMQCEARHGE